MQNNETKFTGSRKKKETKFEKILFGILSVLILCLLVFFALNSKQDRDTDETTDSDNDLASLYASASKIDLKQADYCAELGYRDGYYKASYACLYKIIGK